MPAVPQSSGLPWSTYQRWSTAQRWSTGAAVVAGTVVAGGAVVPGPGSSDGFGFSGAGCAVVAVVAGAVVSGMGLRRRRRSGPQRGAGVLTRLAPARLLGPGLVPGPPPPLDLRSKVARLGGCQLEALGLPVGQSPERSGNGRRRGRGGLSRQLSARSRRWRCGFDRSRGCRDRRGGVGVGTRTGADPGCRVRAGVGGCVRRCAVFGRWSNDNQRRLRRILDLGRRPLPDRRPRRIPTRPRRRARFRPPTSGRRM